MADPVSWLMIEPGWKVRSAGGNDLGKVAQVVGDTGNDIFNGLAISTGLFHKERYVPAERIVEIVEGEVRVDIESDDALEEFEHPPASKEILPPDRGR